MIQNIYPCLWFDTQAADAASFYCKVFSNGNIIEQNEMVVSFEIGGTKFMALNGGSRYKVNPAMSYFVYCGSLPEINRIYNTLVEGGSVLMPLQKYDWSPMYAWVQDKYGVNWQLDVEPIRSSQTIVPCLLFANSKLGQVKQAITHYMDIFPNPQSLLEAPYPMGAGLPEGTLLFAQFKIDGYIINAMSSTLQHDFDFSPGNSIVIACDTQQQIDHFWERLGEGGHYDMCGWLVDKFGVSWQVVPTILLKLLADPSKSQKVVQAFMKMQKFDIEQLKNV